MPATPPPTTVQVIDAFPGVSFSTAVVFASPPHDRHRLFVGEIGGKIKVIPDVTAANPSSSLVLDLADAISSPPRDPAESWDLGPNFECGLLGLAFHPNYHDNGFLYVFYSVVKANDSGVWYQRLSRFTIPESQRSEPAPVADAASEWIILEQRDRGPNHNGGDIHFGLDGYLYIATGDEDNPSDYLNNSQRIDMNFFGALLRIDVDKKAENLEPNLHPNPAASLLGFSSVNGIPRDESPPGSGIFKARYSIPIDNPYVLASLGGTWNGMHNGSAVSSGALPYVRSEFWAIGLRSPWRFFIDHPTGDIWLADVGQSLSFPPAIHAAEEINLITRGGNYGWPYKEGNFPGPKAAPVGFVSEPPYYEIAHNPLAPMDFRARCFIGGVVYHGTRFSSLSGAYIFGDFIYGNIWALTKTDAGPSVRRIAGLASITTFGTDPSNGDVLVTDFRGVHIRRLVTSTPSSSFPGTLGETGLFSDLSTLTPAPEVIPYSVNLPFWSDHAVKSRWVSIPDGESRMTWSREDPWTFPSGQIWVKHFELETIRGNPDSPRKRLETRVLVKNDDGVYGVSYRWNEAGTHATLAADEGESFAIPIIQDGQPYTQAWTIPSRAQCMLCHNEAAGYALSFQTPQLNLEQFIEGVSRNQLRALAEDGYFMNEPESPNVLPRHLRPDEHAFPVEARVRSYLAVNCSYCHAGSAGTAPTEWDARHNLPLAQTGLIHGLAKSAPAPFKLVVPGDPARSVVLQRVGAADDSARMPPLGSSEIDAASVALLSEWITGTLPERVFYDDWRLEVFGSSTSPDGAKDADADGDEFSNYFEFLAGTDPLDPGVFPRPAIHVEDGTLQVGLTVPGNRTVQIEKSTDLKTWFLWDISGNNGLAHPGGPAGFSGPTDPEKGFIRIRLQER